MPQTKVSLINAPLESLSNVQGSATDGQALVWDNTLQKWTPGTVAASGGGAIAATRTLLDNIATAFNGSTTTFDLTVSGAAYTPQNALALEVVLGGIQQQPNTSYTVSGSTITFSVAPAANIPCYIIGTLFSGFSIPSIGTTNPDSDFSSVSLLSRFEGANNSTTFTDESGIPWAISRAGSAVISTAQPKFGTSSALFNGSTDYLILSGKTISLNGDFTIEFWMYPTGFGSGPGGANRAPFSFTTAQDWSGAKPAILLGGGSPSTLLWYTGSTLLTTTNTVSLSQWAHVAFARSGSTLTAYINGVSSGSATYTSTISTSGILIANSSTGSGHYQGYLDEVRLSAVARYTGNFTPPTAAFPGAGVPDLPSPATTGQTATDGNFLYVCSASGSPGTWKRLLLSTF